MFSTWIKIIWALFLLASVAQAQFQFFEQMFGGGGPRQQQPAQDEPSDPSWYQKNWENGEFMSALMDYLESYANAGRK